MLSLHGTPRYQPEYDAAKVCSFFDVLPGFGKGVAKGVPGFEAI
jgi:hypothetical protein